MTDEMEKKPVVALPVPLSSGSQSLPRLTKPSSQTHFPEAASHFELALLQLPLPLQLVSSSSSLELPRSAIKKVYISMVLTYFKVSITENYSINIKYSAF
jgi:hypothetical protein